MNKITTTVTFLFTAFLLKIYMAVSLIWSKTVIEKSKIKTAINVMSSPDITPSAEPSYH